MPSEPTFVDLFALTKITPGLVTDKFGPALNSSFFDASNILGGLKIKGLADFSASLGDNEITVTDAGKLLLAEAEKKSSEPADALDSKILSLLANSKRSVDELATAINITQRDLALHLYKLVKQNYANAEFRNGIMEVVLTEKGFMQENSGAKANDAMQAISIKQAVNAGDGKIGETQQLSNDATPEEVDALSGMKGKERKSKWPWIALVVGIIAVCVVLVIYYFRLI